MDPDRFIRKICHDLRAPLRALQELPGWIEEHFQINGTIVDAEASELLSMMKQQALRMDLIIEGLGQYARLERGAGFPETDVKSLILSTISDKDIAVRQTLDRLAMEPEHALLITRNLTRNALTHGMGKGVTLSISGNGRAQSIAVEDSGPGIPKSQMGLVFEPLSTLRARDVCEGAGMGLPIVKRLAELYDGECRCRPNPNGTGATFEVIWPIT